MKCTPLAAAMAAAILCGGCSDHPGFTRARVSRVIDGDTIVVRQNEGRYTVRFARIDTPELSTRRGQAARELLARRIVGDTVRIRWGDGKDRYRGKYGRLLARVYHNGQDVERWLRAKGAGKLKF